MVAEDPQIARLCNRFVRWCGNLVGIALAFLHGAEQLGQFVLVETQQVQIEVHLLQFGQFDRQQFQVPFGDRRRLVVGDSVGFDLGFASGPVATWTGTFSRPSFWAAFHRVCPTMMTYSASTTMGWRNPNV